MRLTLPGNSYKRITCRACSSPLMESMFSLNKQPLANNLMTTPNVDVELFPLTLTQCSECGLVQLEDTVEPRKLFDHYLYQSGTNKKFVEHFSRLATYVTKELLDGKPWEGYVLDIGSNDGTFLKALAKYDVEAVGVEPAKNLYKKTREKGFNVIRGYFDRPEVAREVIAKYGHARVITACNVFAHVADIHGLIENVAMVLAEDGNFVIEVVDFNKMIESTNFDMIYHEHLFYYTLETLQTLMILHGFILLESEAIDTHGGSIRATFGRNYTMSKKVMRLGSPSEVIGNAAHYAEDVSYKIVNIKNDLEKTEGKRVVGYGAPAKATVFLNSVDWKIPKGFVILEDNKLKVGNFLPVIRDNKIIPIPIAHSDGYSLDTIDVIVIFAWNFADSIKEKCKNLGFKGEFLVLNI